jgi:hypothetical protein
VFGQLDRLVAARVLFDLFSVFFFPFFPLFLFSSSYTKLLRPQALLAASRLAFLRRVVNPS